jgi:serine/threonine-protein kinase
VRQGCESIAEAHARGVIHRDLKPSNLVATRLGLQLDFVKVLDFGLVKFDWQAFGRSTTLTAPQVATGTPAFMAPEAALGERGADHRQDLYSLGCVLYWLLTGYLLFDGDTPLKVMQQHVTEPPVPPSRRGELPIPPELDALVMACLAKKPEERPASALELSTRLAAVPLAEHWTPERARRWWEAHLPAPGAAVADPCDRATVMPQVSSE